MNKVEAREAYFDEAPVAKYPVPLCAPSLSLFLFVSLARKRRKKRMKEKGRERERESVYVYTYAQRPVHGNYLVNSNYF